MSRRDDANYWLFESPYNTVESFLKYAISLVHDTKTRLNSLVLISERDLEEELRSWSPEKFSVRITNTSPVFVIEITKEFDARESESAKAVIVKYSESPLIYLVVSNCTASLFKNIIAKLTNKHYPIVSRMFLTNNEMRQIFRQLEESTQCSIFAETAIGKKRIVGKSRKRESDLTYTDAPWTEAFDKIIAYDGWVQSLKFKARKEVATEGEITELAYSGIISRDCFFSAKRDFRPFVEIVIPLAVQFGIRRIAYLERRSQTAEDPKPEPIVIKFPTEIFADIQKNRQHIDALAELDATSISEYHTNPYIHISMLDYLDGSSYDIWVVSTERMLIIPAYKATTASMSRILNHIYEHIHEGEVEEYEKITSRA